MTMQMTKFDAVQQILDYYDKIVVLGKAAAVKKGLQPACSSGCAACCELSTAVTYPEMELAVSCADDAVLRRVEQRLPEQVRDCLDPKMDNDGWLALRHPCVFLRDDRTCSIYSARPLACRGLVSLNRDHCEARTGTVHQVKLGEFTPTFHRAILGLAAQHGIPSGMGPLPILVHVVLTRRRDGITAAMKLAASYNVDVWTPRWSNLA